jgi:DNA-binding IclR family transcriptional regulator
MKRDALWWQVFWTWFGAATTFYVFTVLPFSVYASGLRHIDLVALSAIATLSVCFLGISLLVAWLITEGTSACAISTLPREEAMRQSLKSGRRVMLYYNPVGLVCAAFLILWKEVLVPLRAVWNLVWGNTLPPDDVPE